MLTFVLSVSSRPRMTIALGEQALDLLAQGLGREAQHHRGVDRCEGTRSGPRSGPGGFHR